MPMYPYRALLTRARLVNRVDRSGAPSSRRFTGRYSAWEGFCNVVFTCQDSVSALFLRTGELRDDAAHDMRIRTRQCFADPEQEIHLRWSQLHVAWLVPVG